MYESGYDIFERLTYFLVGWSLSDEKFMYSPVLSEALDYVSRRLYSADFNDWQRDFISSISESYDRWGRLSRKQATKLLEAVLAALPDKTEYGRKLNADLDLE